MTNEVKELINKVMTDEIRHVHLPYTLPHALDTYLKDDLGLKHYESDNNGWQHDFWYTYNDDKGTRYCFSGSWFYGKYVFVRVED